MKNLIVKIIALIFGVSMLTFSISAQSVVSKDLEYKIMSSFQKNVSLSLMVIYKGLEKRELVPSYSILELPEFGYLPGEIEFSLTKSDLNYPDDNWELYEMTFAGSPQNDSLSYWSWGAKYLIDFNKILIGINEKEEIKFVSGAPFRHPIAKDFKLKKDVPDTYIPFLYLKFFKSEFDSIAFLGKENGKLVFLGSNNKVGDQKSKMKIILDPENPELPGNISVEFIERPKFKSRRKPLYSKFENLEDKKNYLVNNLMKNIYMYRVMHLPDLQQRLNVDLSTRFFKEGHSDLDYLFPNYDQYWDRIDLVTFNLRWAIDSCQSVWKDFQRKLITDKQSNIVGNLMFEGIEFYRLYKDTVEVLYHRIGKYKSSKGYCKIDYYHHPEERKKYDDHMDRHGYPPPPPETLPEVLRFGGDPKCLPYNLPFSEKWKKRMDYYLLALDTKTREVYFLSGKDIYLTEAIHLYPPVNKEVPESIKDWAYPYKLEYIKDRLYRYQVVFVEKDHIVFEDEQKMILEVKGDEYGKQLDLRVTFWNDNPEVLDIEIID